MNRRVKHLWDGVDIPRGFTMTKRMGAPNHVSPIFACIGKTEGQTMELACKSFAVFCWMGNWCTCSDVPIRYIRVSVRPVHAIYHHKVTCQQRWTVIPWGFTVYILCCIYFVGVYLDLIYGESNQVHYSGSLDCTPGRYIKNMMYLDYANS